MLFQIKKTITAYILSGLLAVLSFTPFGFANSAEASPELNNAVDSSPGSAAEESSEDTSITIFDLSPPDKDAESERISAPYNAFHEVLRQWEEAHPSIKVEEKTSETPEDITSLAVFDMLPDIFLMSCSGARTYANRELILDLTKYVKASPYFDLYDSLMLEQAAVEDKIYAFPALCQVHSIVLYDTAAFSKVGCDSFPADWDRFAQLNDQFKKLGYLGTITQGNVDTNQYIQDIISPLLAARDHSGWFKDLAAGTGTAMFLDPIFLDVLETAQIPYDSEIINKDQAVITASESSKYFISGKYPAILARGDEIFRILDTLEKEDPDFYKRVGFAVLPLPDSADDIKNGSPSEDPLSGAGKSDPSYLSTAMPYGLFINSKLIEDPEKLTLCIDLCETLSGPAYSSIISETCGYKTLIKAGQDIPSLSNQIDRTEQRYLEAIYDAEPCHSYTSFLDYNVWLQCMTDFMYMSDGYPRDAIHDFLYGQQEYTIEERAARLENVYERFYLDLIPVTYATPI